MKKVIIGRSGSKDLDLDVEKLITTRLLVQASSGGGKSYALRKIIEETNGQAQQIILDIEDDFSSLRERHDFVLVGKGGDVPASVGTAALMARKLLELRADAVINLYELSPDERIEFVTCFLTSMVNAPKELWHPCMVFLDEGHLFCPEVSKEKEKADVRRSVIDMASRGRKRGYCLIVATQRPAKLSKDVAAECQNKLIGLANLDIDRKRSGEELGLTDRAALMELRDLNPGEFFAVGPAFPKGVLRMKIGAVKTKHGANTATAWTKKTPTGKVAQILAKLAELPQEAEEEAEEIERLRKENASLKSQLRQSANGFTKANIEDMNRRTMDRLKVFTGSFSKFVAESQTAMAQSMEKKILELGRSFERDLGIELKAKPSMAHLEQAAAAVAQGGFRNVRAVVASSRNDNASSELGKCELELLKFLAMREGRFFKRNQIGAMTGYSSTSGGFNSALSRLYQFGLVGKNGDSFSVSDKGSAEAPKLLGAAYHEPEPDAVMRWLNEKLGACERKVFEFITENRGHGWTRNQIGDKTGYSSTSGGFNSALSHLVTLGLVEKNGQAFTMSREFMGAM